MSYVVIQTVFDCYRNILKLVLNVRRLEMSHRSTLVLSVFLLSGSAYAAKPIATLSSSGPVVVSGTSMSAATVAFWPVANRDEITTLDSAAVLILPDNSRITLNQN